MEYTNDNAKADDDFSFLDFIQNKMKNISSEPEKKND